MIDLPVAAVGLKLELNSRECARTIMQSADYVTMLYTCLPGVCYLAVQFGRIGIWQTANDEEINNPPNFYLFKNAFQFPISNTKYSNELETDPTTGFFRLFTHAKIFLVVVIILRVAFFSFLDHYRLIWPGVSCWNLTDWLEFHLNFISTGVNCFWDTATPNCRHWAATIWFITTIWPTSPAPIKNVSFHSSFHSIQMNFNFEIPFFYFSFKDWRFRSHCLPNANQRRFVPVAPDFIATRLQEQQTRFHY